MSTNTYEDYILSAIKARNAIVATDNDNYSGLCRVAHAFNAKAELYSSTHKLFATIILFPECLDLNEQALVDAVNKDKELFIYMIMYFTKSPLGNLVKDPQAINHLL